ncbi:dicarboxylate/amino acid:cation symporter [Granulicella mallensis]|uniref:Sodium:dicarboxylate symporter n=1 Tax=Granulicella mallensis (strain ATCC BAA-1857 / DSM 23137 / MP5ACTX8) TaxID=682795 RepID=G8NY07_GRAMM|nr:cation:dicarboxylase symporter family transporter [Granulicella mallensis]AEU35595.1 sodium:dicarboxylate symporter [Granulicella mallensis MP5ACTX8]
MAKGFSKKDLVLLGPGLAALALGAVLQLPHVHVPHDVALGMRWLGVVLLAAFAVQRRSLTPWIFVAMVAGAELGFDAPHFAVGLRVFSDIFLRLIKTIVAPLILATLVVGIAGHGDLKSVGRMGIKALVYFEVVTTLALGIGLLAINITRAGVGLSMSAATKAVQVVSAPPPTHWDDFLLHVFPENIAKSIAEGQILQVAVFAVFFGIALATLSEAKRGPVLRLCESLSEVMFRFTNVVMYFAPIGVGAAMAYTVGNMGLGVLVNLGKLLLTLYGALAMFGVLVLLPAAMLFKVPIANFIAAVAEPATIAFATATSEAALPRAMEQMEALGVPRRIVAFVIPAGYSFNLDGSTLYLAVASIFVAQAAGISMSIGQQLLMMVTLVLTSKGVAGVPRATLVVLLATASTFHLPVEPIFVILGIDALMDMARTMVNVVGNCLASVVVAKWEGVFGTELLDEVVLEGIEA